MYFFYSTSLSEKYRFKKVQKVFQFQSIIGYGFVFFFFVSLSFLSYSQERNNVTFPSVSVVEKVHLTGVVQHAITAEKLSGVLVRLDGTAFTQTTDSAGEFRFSNVPVGKYVLTCVFKGFETLSTPININSGTSSRKVISLIPEEIELSDLLNILVVTATKSEKKLDDIASFVDVITAEQIKHRGYRHLADVLNDLLHNHQDRGNWGIGEPLYQNVGFGFRFDTGQNMLLLFNGQRLNAFLPGNRFGGEEYLTENIERIEIVRGPGSALYGANAFTSVVNIITKQQLDNEKKGFFTVRPMTILSPFSNGVGYGGSLNLGVKVDSTFITGSFQGLSDPGQNIFIRNSLFGDALLQDRIRHALVGDILIKYQGLRVFAKLSNQSRNTMTGFNSVSKTDQSSVNDQLSLSSYAYSLGADYLWDISPQVQLKISAGWHQDNWTEVGLIPLFKTNASGTGLLYDERQLPILDTVSVRRNGQNILTSFPIDGQGGDSRTLEGEIQGTWNFTPTNSLIIGVNAIEDKVISAVRPSEIQLSPSFQITEFTRFQDNQNNWLFDTQASRITLGVYAQADYDITSELSVTAGARLDMYSGTGILREQQYTEFNPRGGIVYKHPQAGIFKLSYGRAMRVPNGFEALSSVTILGDPSLRPERLEMAQAVWIKNWNPTLRTELGGFIASVSNRLLTDAAISEQLKAQGFIGQFINVANNVRQQSNGLDAKLILRLGDNDIILNGTQYLGTDNGSGQSIGYIPTSMVNANFNIPIHWLNVNVGMNYRSRFTQPSDDVRQPVPAYLLATVTFTGKPFDAPFEFQVGGRNLLNSNIQAPSSSRDFTEHFRGRQVEFWLSLSYRFE